jgi:di/tricarboxylate transporter
LTTEQILTFVILAGVMAALIHGRLRYDLVGLTALALAIAAGIVEPAKAFTGFSDDIVIIVASALVVSAAVGRSGIADFLMRPLAPHLTSTEVQIAVLVATVALLSAFMKNIGALAIFIPIAFQLAKRTGKPVSTLLMPMAFGSLLGGLMTLIGTSPNIIVSRVRQEIVGQPFSMFDFMPVGLALTVAGTLFLVFGWRLLPRTQASGASAPETLFSVDDYQSEVVLPAGSPLADKTVRDLENLGEGEVSVVAIIREGGRRYTPRGHWVMFGGDILVLQCDAHALDRIVSEAKLELLHDEKLEKEGEKAKKIADTPVVEVVVTPESVLIGSTAGELNLRDIYGVNLLAIGRRGGRITNRLTRVRFQSGDLLVLRAPPEDASERLAAIGCLPLAERRLQLGRPRSRYMAPAILALAMIAAATGITTVAVAFFAAAVAIVLFTAVTLKEAYDAIEWPILVLLGSLIPISDALRATGGTELIAGWLSLGTDGLPPTAALGLVMVAAMAVTPFLNNAATVLMMAPIGASLAGKLNLNVDAFLMAVAIGAACDFLTPIGHQCNTLVMGPGGYKFGDYWRLGLPLSVLVVVLGVPLIALFWPLR